MTTLATRHGPSDGRKVSLGAAVALAAGLALLAWVATEPAPAAVRLGVETAKPGAVAVLVDRGEAQPPVRHVRELSGPGATAVDVPLPEGLVSSVRLEPGSGAGALRLTSLELVSASGRPVHVVTGPLVYTAVRARVDTAGGVTTVVPEPSGGAQVTLMLPSPLLCPGPPRTALLAVLVAVILAIVGAWALALSPRAAALARSPWLARGVVLACMAAAIAAVITMAVVSRPGAHPDELGHVAAAGYYARHWLPAPVGAPELEPTMMARWARSYLFDLDVVYPVAGKVAAVLGEPVVGGLRGFQVALLVALAVLAVWLAPRVPAVPLMLGLGGEALYVFSYVNGDGFPLALSLAAAALVAVRCSEPEAGLGRRDAVIIGLLLALTLVSKANFRVFVPYALVALAAQAVGLGPSERRTWLRRVGLAAGIVAAVFVVRWGYEEAINGFAKEARVESWVEAHAEPGFRHSEVHSPVSYEGLYLREKGVEAREMLSRLHWHRLSLMSFFGMYGRMRIESPRVQYLLAGILALIVVAGAAALAWARGGTRHRWVLGLSAATVGAIVLQSFLRSWIFDMQPQGRYLLPVLPVGVIALSPGLRRLPAPVLAAALVALYGVTLWSLVFAGIGQIAR